MKTPSGIVVKVLSGGAAHKWLGSMISAGPLGADSEDLNYHLQSANKAFHANRWILSDNMASLFHRMRYFQTVVSPVACFGSCRRTVYAHDLRKADIQFRKLLRQVVRPPAEADWSLPYHEVLHAWHGKIAQKCEKYGIRTWSQIALKQYWHFASYVARLPADRWLSRVLRWMPYGMQSQGRPILAWDAALVKFCKANSIGDWKVAAQDDRAWLSLTEDFITFYNMA